MKPYLWLLSYVVSNNYFVIHLVWLVISSSWFFVTYFSLLRISATMFPTPDIFWMSGPNYFKMSCLCINLLYSLRVETLIIFLSGCMFIYYPNIIPLNFSRYYIIYRSSLSVILYLCYGFISILKKKSIVLLFWLITSTNCLP